MNSEVVEIVESVNKAHMEQRAKTMSENISSLVLPEKVKKMKTFKDLGSGLPLEVVAETQVYEERIKDLKKCYVDLKDNFIRLGGYLIDAKSYCTKVFSYKLGRPCFNVYEFANEVLNMSKSTCINLIAICERFGQLRTSLKSEYAEYSYTQLAEMLPLDDEQIKLINPEMTKVEIRQFNKMQKNQLAGQNETEDKKQLESTYSVEPTQLGYSLKNDKERLQLIKNYTDWGVWLQLEELGLKFYKCDLNNGDYIVVTETTFTLSPDDINYDFYCKRPVSSDYRIVKKGTSPTCYGFGLYATSDNEYLGYMKYTKAKVYITKDCYNKVITGVNE